MITGTNRGIGLALVSAFLKEDHQVFATVRHRENCEDLNRLQEKKGQGQLQIHEMDVTLESSVGNTFQQMNLQTSRLDLLINNAGVYPEDGDELFEDLNPEWFEKTIQVNYLGTVRVTRHFLPLIKNSPKASIVNLSSGAASITTKEDGRRYCYGASKAALNMFSRTLAAELKSSGIIVVALSPGWVRTEMGGPNADLSIEESAQAIVKTSAELTMENTGQFLDRFGTSGKYAW